jgi:hypothetical protein
MKFKQYLQEEYVSPIYGKFTGKKVQDHLFCNPTAKELSSIGNGEFVRFIINFRTKKIYVWIGTIMHFEAAELLYNMKMIPTEDLDSNNFWDDCFAGTGEIVSYKIRYLTLSDYYKGEFDLDWLEGNNNKWVDKWFVESLSTSLGKELGHWYK